MPAVEPGESLARARAFARALDSAVRIPGTNIRFGLDPVLGLVPGLGDAAGAGLAGYLILLAARAGAPRTVILRMVANIAIDAGVGVIPFLGDIFDVAWKANTRNIALLERYLDQPAATTTTSRALVGGAIAALSLIAIGGVALAVVIVRALLGALR